MDDNHFPPSRCGVGKHYGVIKDPNPIRAGFTTGVEIERPGARTPQNKTRDTQRKLLILNTLTVRHGNMPVTWADECPGSNVLSTISLRNIHGRKAMKPVF